MNVCFINNYNYGCFLKEAIESALNQTYPFDLIIIIDDCSNDESKSILKDYERVPIIKVIYMNENLGQLSVFNEVLKYLPANSRVFFLDSDDNYPLNYLELFLETVNYYKLHDFEFIYTSAYVFSGNNSKKYIENFDIERIHVVKYECSSYLTRKYKIYVGGPTSTLSVTTNLLRKILPYEEVSEWRIRADDIIVFASSVLGAKKVFLPELFINYRVHNNNNFYGKMLSQYELVRRRLSIEKFFNKICDRYNLNRDPAIRDVLSEISIYDYKSIKNITNHKHSQFKLTILFALSKIYFKLRKLILSLG